MATVTATRTANRESRVAKSGKNTAARKTVGTQDTGILVVAAALKRAQGAIEKLCGKAKLDEGGYPIDLTVAIKGDITVAKPTPEGQPQTVPDFSTHELLGATYAVLGDDAGPVLDKAMRKIKTAKGGSAKIAAEIQKNTDQISEAAIHMAMERGITTEKSSPARAGAVSGKPSVTVTGTVGTNTVNVTVEE